MLNKCSVVTKFKQLNSWQEFFLQKYYHPMSFTCALRMCNAAIQKRSTKGQLFKEDDCTFSVYLSLLVYGLDRDSYY